VPAYIGGKSVCLRVGLKCRARYERAYQRKGFKCLNGRLQKIPPAPPPATALAGLYTLTTSQCIAPNLCRGGILTVDPGGLTFTNFKVAYIADCTPDYHFISSLTTDTDALLPIDPGLTFAISDAFSIQIFGTPSIPHGMANAITSGQFDTAGNVTGKFDVHVSGDDSAGTHHECDTGQVTFSGKLSPTG
jgi:hypothetical protein